MTPIQQKALASIALPESFVADIYDCAFVMTREKAIEELKRLCVSHERLRAELIGAQAVVADIGNPVCECGKLAVFNFVTNRFCGSCSDCMPF